MGEKHASKLYNFMKGSGILWILYGVIHIDYAPT